MYTMPRRHEPTPIAIQCKRTASHLATTIKSELAEWTAERDPRDRAAIRVNLIDLCAKAIVTNSFGPEPATFQPHPETRRWFTAHRRWFDILSNMDDHELSAVAAARCA